MSPVIALTMGDPAGIGLEITIKAWTQRGRFGNIPFALFADPGAVKTEAQRLQIDLPIAEIDRAPQAAKLFRQALPIVPIALKATPKAGHPNKDNALAVIDSIKQSVRAIANGEAAAIVTNPIAKNVLYDAGFQYPGHTEFLGALANEYWPQHSPYAPVMMLTSDTLRVVPVTIHLPISEVPKALTHEHICHAARLTHATLMNKLQVERPRLAVCGLNPHAGENGTIGTEDNEIIAPAIRTLQSQGLTVSGPHAADALFHAKALKSYDAFIAMYHDQALIPFKTLAFDSGVNVTLGLPFTRTSPDHGTAFQIAGSGTASPESLVASLRMAHHLS